MGLFKKSSLRRTQVRKRIFVERPWQLSQFFDTDIIISTLLWLLFVILCIGLLSFEFIQQRRYVILFPLSAIVVLISLAIGLYIYHYQSRIIKNHVRNVVLVGLLLLFLFVTKVGVLSTKHTSWATGWVTATATIVAIIFTIAYDQRFAIGMGIFYCILACFAAGAVSSDKYQLTGFSLFLTALAAVITCCFSLREIRKRMKLLEVSTLTSVVVFATATSTAILDLSNRSPRTSEVLTAAAGHAGAAFIAGLLIQSLLPVIEKIFRIATSMTLLDYSDANQPLLKRLAMEAPGTFSHSLLIGSVAEAAAEAVGCNGLLCRVGAYYHDIGKINKPKYFVENEMGSVSRHKELSPAMSQLIIVGHVKDGIEMAKEYGLPAVLRQFIETHHGTTLVEPFYNEARKKHEAPASGSSRRKPKQAPPSENEFRYPGPRPRTKEAAIVMLADVIEGAVRSLAEVTPTKVEAVVHNMAMKRLQDGQFDECDLTLRELSQIETSISKILAAHYHGRIAYPTAPDVSDDAQTQPQQAFEDQR